MTRAPLVTVTALVLAAALAGCAEATAAPAAPVASPTKAAAQPAAPADNSCEPRRSFRPAGALPAPGSMPPGSFMEKVFYKGRLDVGTSQDTLLFSSRNSFTGQIEGFDVDVLREVARAIFGDPDKIRIKAIAYDKRVPFTADGTVDIVADTMTINCARWKIVDFTTVYYEAGQKVLVSSTSAAKSIKDLGGKRVCAATGSTSIENLERQTPKPIVVGVPAQPDCLVAFQSNKVDAISTDDTILAGLAAQDPYAKVIGDRFSEEPYGMSVSKAHPEFTQFVNAVLDKMRADGTWKALYAKWLGKSGPVPEPPPAQYRN